MSYGVSSAQAWRSRESANSASIAAGAISATSLGEVGTMVLSFGDVADATDATYTGLPYKIRIIDAYAIKTTGAGNAGNTVTLRTAAAGGGTAVTSAMVLNVDAVVARTTVIDDAGYEFDVAASLFLRFAKVGGVNNGLVVLKYIRVA